MTKNNSIDALTAMTCVNEHLSANDFVGAQAIVLVIEKDASVLPSSVFEKVLKAAVLSDSVLPEYETFCRRAYGRQFDAMVAQLLAA